MQTYCTETGFQRPGLEDIEGKTAVLYYEPENRTQFVVEVVDGVVAVGWKTGKTGSGPKADHQMVAVLR